jgi:hypothetical protein
MRFKYKRGRLKGCSIPEVKSFILSRRALGFARIEYPDLGCLFCVGNIHP